jgi:NADH:ubiquinone oxidoreductase subunit E
MEESSVAALEGIYQDIFKTGGNIILVLQEIQKAFGYIPEDAVNWFSRKTDIPSSKFFGVVTFYSQFHLQPRGKNIITACCGTVCHVKGADRVISRLRDELSLKPGQDTTRDKQFTLENVNCVGACSIAPIVIVNDKIYGNMNPDKIVKNLQDYREDK